MPSLTKLISSRRDLLLAAAAACAPALALLAQPALAAHHGGPPVPDAIKVPSGNQVFLVGHAVGVQIYSCAPTATGPAWTFVAPRADLYGDNGKLIIKHFAGPTWQARDGSTVVGALVDKATVDATAIPWLLLSAASTTAGPDGDRLTHTTYIQRIATTGGLAPAAATCSAATLGATVEIPYTADYYFWKAHKPAA